MKKILANGYVYDGKKGISIDNRKRLIINTDYKNITSSFLEKVEKKIIDSDYVSNWLSIQKHGFLEEHYINEWNQLTYTRKNGGGSISLEDLVEITILK